MVKQVCLNHLLQAGSNCPKDEIVGSRVLEASGFSMELLSGRFLIPANNIDLLLESTLH
jgi:hypothetical protein